MEHDGDEHDELDAGLRGRSSSPERHAVSCVGGEGFIAKRDGCQGERHVTPNPPAACTTSPRVVVILEEETLADSGS